LGELFEKKMKCKMVEIIDVTGTKTEEKKEA
jgi:hypothetical protein